ncbi:cytochrome P450 [Streptomyces sp. Ru73]|uniref:cytochrome P450 n=1 Tax=Streptomyces sp. Ru73 TaxID=2080748 RepID=UPI0015E2F387|nr:cytochrome P450 [Streptomyces sp. Ru73]
MTTHPDPHSSSTPAPPPGCPAHTQSTARPWQRIYGPDAEPLGPVLERLRQQYGDVAPVLAPGDIPAYLILGYHAIRDAMQTSNRLTCDSRRGRVYQEGLITADHPLAPMTAYQPVMAFEDGAPHQRLRNAVTDSLDFNRHSLRRYIGRYANRLIDGFAGRGTADLVAEYAAQLPALVIAWMYGLPEEESPALVSAVRDLTSGNERAAEGNAFVTRTMQELVERRQAGETSSHTLGRDFVSRLLEHESGLSEQEVVEHLRLVFVAGYTPTVALIANTLLEILTQRQFSQNLTSGQMTLPEALNRVLWDHPPISLLPTRWAAGDMVLGGQQIRAGDMIILGIEAANADPAARRPGLSVEYNEGHLSFSTGPHECPFPARTTGQAIAEEGIDILLNRLRDLELVVSEEVLTWQSAWVSRRLLSLPVKFTPPRPTGTRVHQPEIADAAAGTSASTSEPWTVQGGSPAPHTKHGRTRLRR